MTKRSKKDVKKSTFKKRKAPLRLYSYYRQNPQTGRYEAVATLAHNWNEAVEKIARSHQTHKGDWGLHSLEEYR